MKRIFLRGIIVSLIVGTLLTVINQFEHITDWRQLNFVKAALSYLVPLGVSVFSALAVNNKPDSPERTAANLGAANEK